MNTFVNRFGASIMGVISGFDRLVFGLSRSSSAVGVLLKDFMPWTTSLALTGGSPCRDGRHCVFTR